MDDETGEIVWHLCNWRADGFYLDDKPCSLDAMNLDD